MRKGDHLSRSPELQLLECALLYCVFDVMMLAGRNVMNEPLERRRELLRRAVSKVKEPVRISHESNASLGDLITSVKAQGLEGW
jgi:ATP-dependent DNA ligase